MMLSQQIAYKQTVSNIQQLILQFRSYLPMLDKLLGKKEKGLQIFNIPEKKYCTQQKKMLKMDRKQLTDVINDMQKYIGHICQKLQLGKKQYERSLQKAEQLMQKSKVLNGQMSRINNQHEQLQVKFTNLQNSLQIMTHDRESIIQSQCKYIQQHGFSKQKIKDFNKIFHIYQTQITILDKTSQQNKQLKQKLETLQAEYHKLSQKFNQVKVIQANVNIPQQQLKQTHQDSQQKDSDNKTKCGECIKLQSMIQGKQQIIMSLNKQITSQRQKIAENSDKIEELNSDLQQILGNISLKDEQLMKLRQQNSENINLLNGYKKNQVKYKTNQQKNKQQLAGLNKSLAILQKQVNDFNLKVEKLQIEKKIIMEKNQSKLADTQQSYNRLQREYQNLKNSYERKEIEMQNVLLKLNSYQTQIINSSKINQQLQAIKKQLTEQKHRNEQMKNNIKNIQQEYQIKLKKIQFSANQERIKSDGLKRNLTQIQAKEQQNRKNLDSMYENKILQDGKIVQMEKKLKQYKHLIQYLKKQKIQLQKTFQSKIKNMEEMVINQIQEEQQQGKQNRADKRQYNLSPNPKIIEGDQYQKQMILSQKKIAVLEEQMDMLRQENLNLRTQKDQLIQANIDMQDKLKSLTQKRQQVMRQIKKMSSINYNGNHPVKQKQNSTTQQIKSRQRKIAQKAYKGFDILSKLLSALYKQFINVHLSDIARKQVKQIQSSINSIVRKSLDMKDIFQDYI